MTMHMISFEEDVDHQRRLRDALGRFATGITVVTTVTPDGKQEGLTANSFSAVSLDPPLVLWSLRRAAPSLKGFLAAGRFAVNVLAADQHHLCRHFATPARDKFRGVPHTPGLGGCPLLSGSLASFECETETTIESGDHVIIIGRVQRATYRNGEPLIFSAGAYGTHSPLPV
jgi:flavin reductase (DIM6/NTAB) family NADH-FMN oxidoreductase RutF